MQTADLTHQKRYWFVSRCLVLVLVVCSGLVALLSSFRHVQNSEKGPTAHMDRFGPSPMSEVNQALGAAHGGDRVVGSLFFLFSFFVFFLTAVVGLVAEVFAKLSQGLILRGRAGGAWGAGKWQLAEAAVS